MRATIILIIATAFAGCASKREFRAEIKRLDSALMAQSAALKSEKVRSRQALQSLDSATVKTSVLRSTLINQNYELYGITRKCGDIQGAIAALNHLELMDSSTHNWIYDSLAFYHYFYNTGNGNVRNANTPLFYAEKGLTIQPKNTFLQEIKAKLLLETGNDTASYALLTALYDRTRDYTFLWDMAYVEMARGNTKKAEQVIKQALNSADITLRTVRLESIADRVLEEVPAKAAFLYLKSIILNGKRDYQGAYRQLQEVLRLAPNCFAARKTMYEMEKALSGGY
ncbi:MAG: hypothetical protein JNL57_10560 [Bacteroidetes bacterium]|nr:hypothetical protein [Bacteroidota bacterium]